MRVKHATGNSTTCRSWPSATVAAAAAAASHAVVGAPHAASDNATSAPPPRSAAAAAGDATATVSLRAASASAGGTGGNVNLWRGEEAARQARHEIARLLDLQQERPQGGRMLWVPLNALTPGWSDEHPGYLNKTGSLDCTHFCNSEFLFEPLWWSIRKGTAR